jgi:pimeloyl-ACP methyl ester carboxylesterase
MLKLHPFLQLIAFSIWTTVLVASDRIDLKPCSIEGVQGRVLCGHYEVPEDRQRKDGRLLSLKIVVLCPPGTKHEADPLFILAGGPGQAATRNVKFIADTFDRVRAEREIVLVDQRGTDGSNPLDCDPYGQTAQGHLGELFPIEAIRQCVEELKASADLRFYTSDIAMADLDEVRAAMGYERINLFGTSYGTRTAQVYMRRFPERVRSVIMKGVAPITTPLTLPMAKDAQRALDLLFDDCAADSPCHDAFPNVKQEFEAVWKRLEKDIEIELPVDRDKKEHVTVSRATFAPTIRTVLQSVDTTAKLPLQIHQAFTGNLVPITQAALNIRRQYPMGVSIGMFLSVTAIEDVAASDAKEVAHRSDGTFLQDHYFKMLDRAASILPKKEMPADFHKSVQSNIPTLLISGFLDPATPPSAAEEVARYLPNSRSVVVRYGSHSYDGMSPCIDNVMAEFIAHPSAKDLDTSCVDQIRRPPFVITDTEEKESGMD